MKFLIDRTSSWKQPQQPPIEKAIRYITENNKNSIYYQWYINIKSLKEIIELCNIVGEIVVSKEDGDLYKIEIYDDYRE